MASFVHTPSQHSNCITQTPYIWQEHRFLAAYDDYSYDMQQEQTHYIAKGNGSVV